MAPTDSPELSRIERTALRLMRWTNEHPEAKRVQQRWLRRVSQRWMFHGIAQRTYVDGVEWLVDHQPDRGVVLASNHRSFFDQYTEMLALYESGVEWAERQYFPVRANFFYDQPLGVMVNAVVGAGVMYPPIFRERAKAERNKESLSCVTDVLREPGVVVGVHPEGTRGKGPDPYEMLPAQPGIGQIVLHARPLVVPAFINGLTNDFVGDIRRTYRPEIRRQAPVIIVFGKPVDYSEFTTKKPRTALYKRCADRIRDSIIGLMERERELRERCTTGWMRDDDPGWLPNRRHATLVARGN